MAKRGKQRKPYIPETIRDEEGYETDGMFRWGGPKKRVTKENLQHWVDDFNTDFLQAAPHRIGRFRDHITQLIQPFVDGPFTEEEVAKKKFYGRKQVRLKILLGDGIYVFHKGLPEYGYWTDAVDAVQELEQLRELIKQNPPNVDRIVSSAIRAGVLISQAQLRAIFAPEVLAMRKRRQASAKGGKATTRFTDDVRSVAVPIFRKFKRANLSDEYASVRTAAELKSAHGIKISPKTIKRRLALASLDIA